MRTLVPVDDRIIAVRLSGDTKSKAGIYLPESEKRKSQLGLVIASGPGEIVKETLNADSDQVLRIPNVAKKGDTVIFNTYSGNEITLDGTDYVILLNRDVLAIVEVSNGKA